MKLKLGDICEIIGGIPAPKNEEIFTDGKVPFVRMQDLGRYHKTTSLRMTRDSINPIKLENKNRGFVRAGSILLPRSGSVSLNHRAILAVDAYIVSHICALRVKDPRILNTYLYYFLSIFDMKRLMKKTTGLDAITFSDLAKITISFPSLFEQKRIVSILEKAEKIKEKRILATKFSKNIVNSIFYGKTSEQSIEKKAFLDIFEVKTGKLNSNAATVNGAYPFFTCSKKTFRINNYSFDCEALLLSGNNAAGEYSVKYYNGKFNAYQRTYILTLKDEKFSYHYFQLLLEKKLSDLKSISIGTNTKYLTLGIMRGIVLPVPSVAYQKKVSNFYTTYLNLKEKQELSEAETENLYISLIQSQIIGLEVN